MDTHKLYRVTVQLKNDETDHFLKELDTRRPIHPQVEHLLRDEYGRSRMMVQNVSYTPDEEFTKAGAEDE